MLGLNWLERVFHPYTSQKSGNRRRLLIVDGHSSHINMQFIKKCDELRILLLVLPAHSTHRLQPLDVGLFAPLATYYTNGLNDLMAKSFGMVRISKRAFWSVFLPAWQNAFSEQNIMSAFRKTGIWPYNPTPMLKTITPPEAVLPASQSPKTPMTCLTHRRTQRKFKTKPSEQIVVKLFKANDCLIIKDSINQHIINGLRATIQNEKKKRQRGKRLDLCGNPGTGPQFFSSEEVRVAKELQASKEEQKAQHQLDIAAKRQQTAIKKS